MIKKNKHHHDEADVPEDLDAGPKMEISDYK